MKNFFTHSETNWFCVHDLFRVTAFSIFNRKRQSWTGYAHTNLSVVTTRMELQRSEKFLQEIERCEGGISARAQKGGLSMKKSTPWL